MTNLHESGKPTASETFVLFELAGSTCGLSTEVVQSVEMVETVSAVPNALPYVEGVALTRGKVIPLINLRVRFGFPRIPTDSRSRMLVVRLEMRTAGLLVDGAREFVSIPADAIQSRVEERDGFDARFVGGVANVGNRSVMILNLKELVEGK